MPAEFQSTIVPDSDGATRALRSLTPIVSSAIVHSLDVDLPISALLPRRLRRIRTVATVHDLSVFDVPWAFSKRRGQLERAALTVMLRRADELIAVSDFTADRIRHRFGRSATVTRLAPHSSFGPAASSEVDRVRDLYGLGDRFVLHVGTIEPRKDVPGLAEACRRIGVPLVTAGSGSLSPADAIGVSQLGYVPAEHLNGLYAAASVVAYPSRYEGFGLPPIEAMAAGAAVVVTAVGALPELAAGSDFPLVRPNSQADLEEHLEAAVNDAKHSDHLRKAGAAMIGSLSWRATARTTVSVYERLSDEAISLPSSS